MTSLDQQITSAIKNLIRRNGGEIHGGWPEIADKIAVEINGIPDDYLVKKYEEHLRTLFFEDHPDIFFIRSADGELNFIDRKKVYTACEVTVHRVPGCEPVIDWREVNRYGR